MSMTAGDWNRRVAFEEEIDAGDLAGAPGPAEDPDPLLPPGGDPLGPARLWVERFQRWAEMEPERTQRETAQGGALTASGLWRCELPHDPETAAVSAERWRLRLGGSVFNIRHAEDPDGLRRAIVMILEKSVAT